ncbi:unnamed protein product [Diamesa hyperborea]
MVGKSKAVPRTKGNARPANSSRSVELLGDNVPTFVGFTAMENGIVPVVPGFGNMDELENTDALDSTFQLVFRKMNKKDSTTKIKALKEFTELVEKSDVDIMKTVLPFWPKMFVQLSVDIEPRVRENTQTALLSIVIKVGKNIGPFLKNLIPAWISSIYDTHPPAASIALKSFETAFTQKKINDVFAFCEKEILDYFSKNVTVFSAQTICNQKVYSPEESEAKYQRVLISSLRGYAMYLSKIPKEKLEQSSIKNLMILENSKFLSLYKHKTPHIRSAWFETISSLLQHGSFLIDEKLEKQLTSNVFNSIDETEPALLSHIWSCIILVQLKIDNWNAHINIEKVLCPKLWNILRSGSSPCVIYPHLLPLISKFNKTTLPDDKLLSFYLTYFENINYGLRNVQLSRSEVSAIAISYYEVLQYIIVQIANDKEMSENSKMTYCSSLLDDHMIAVIYWCMNAESSSGKYVFHHIAALLNYWSKHSQTVDLYKTLLSRFWSELCQVLATSVERSNNIKNITSSHIELIKNLRDHAQNQKSKKNKIRFVDETDKSNSAQNIDTSESTDGGFVGELNDLVYKLCCIYVEKVSTTFNIEFVENLEWLIKDYQSVDLFRCLAKWNDSNESNICTLYDTFSKWLLSDELRCESIIEIVLVLYKYLKPVEKINLLNRWIQLPAPSVQSWIIMRALSHPLCLEPDITELLKMQEVTDHLIECSKQVSNGVFKDNFIILQKCFFQTEDGNILIDIPTCEKIVDIMVEPLHNDEKKNSLDSSGSFLAQILPVVCFDPQKKAIQRKIFLALFDFSISNELSDDLSEDTLWEVTTAWQDALSSDDVKMDDELLNLCSRIISNQLLNVALTNMTIEDLERLTEIVSKLILCSCEQAIILEGKQEMVEKIIAKIMLEINDKNIKFERYIENLSQYVELSNGNLVITDFQNTVEDYENFDNNTENFIKNRAFKLDVIIKLCCNIKKRSIAEESSEAMDEVISKNVDEECTEDYCDLEENLLKSWTATLYNVFLDISYSESILNVLLMSNNHLHPETESWILYYQEKLTLLLKSLPDEIVMNLKEKLFEAANTKGGLWCKCLLGLRNAKEYSGDDGVILLYEDASLSTSNAENISSYINILQSFSNHNQKKFLPISSNLFENYSNLLIKLAAARSLMINHIEVGQAIVEDGHRKIVGNALILINEVLTAQKIEPFLMYNKDISEEPSHKILLVVEVALLLTDILTLFPNELEIKRFDFIRIALSSWVLSVTKSIKYFNKSTVGVFIVSVFKLNASLSNFILTEKTKSSTQVMQNIIDEWEDIFARDVNLVLLKSFVYIIRNIDQSSKHQETLVNAICPYIGSIDFKYVLQTRKVDPTISLDDLLMFAKENLSNKQRSICTTSAKIIKQLSEGLVRYDMDTLIERNSEDITSKHDDDDDMEGNKWHILESFRDTLSSYQDVMREYTEDFNFKINELDFLSKISPNVAMSYLLLWDCILNFCCTAPAELRSIYARWITTNQFEEIFLIGCFKMMPADILKNPDSSTKYGQNLFSTLKWSEITGTNIQIERYAAFLYAECLRTLPAVARKWWHASNTRQAQIIDKITMNNVSPILCQEELSALVVKKDKEKDNMHIKVLIQSRQILATYSLEEAKMELVINLPPNHPLGAVKVESTKLIGGKLHARQVVMQLSLYLNLNGRLFDGIAMWKKNLDRKFEGVEECFVCYSVIHQDNFQLPRLTCKTCRKKFHGPCLYRWFSTSNKSTCPICRNIF